MHALPLAPQLEAPPMGASIDFIRAENSAFQWADRDVARIQASGARVHLLRNSGHWVARAPAPRARYSFGTNRCMPEQNNACRNSWTCRGEALRSPYVLGARSGSRC